MSTVCNHLVQYTVYSMYTMYNAVYYNIIQCTVCYYIVYKESSFLEQSWTTLHVSKKQFNHNKKRLVHVKALMALTFANPSEKGGSRNLPVGPDSSDEEAKIWLAGHFKWKKSQKK